MVVEQSLRTRPRANPVIDWSTELWVEGKCGEQGMAPDAARRAIYPNGTLANMGECRAGRGS